MSSGRRRHHCRYLGGPRARTGDGNLLSGSLAGPVDGPDHRGFARPESGMEEHAMVSRDVRIHPRRIHLVRSARNVAGDETVVGDDAKSHPSLVQQPARSEAD